jgi:hypothetical protein
MTPQERNLVTELFERLARLEDAPRDPEAARLIMDGLRQAPNAVYALVQTVLVQDEALKRADTRIRELEDERGGESEPPERPAGFLDNVRGALFGTPEPRPGAAPAGSVPSVRPREPGMDRTAGMPGAQPMYEPAPAPGGSFLGTAAATAAGMIGGSLLLGGIRSMMGTGHASGARAAFDPSGGSQRDLTTPWSNTPGGDLAREAGIDHIGRSPPQAAAVRDDDDRRGLGAFDNASASDYDHDDSDDDDTDDVDIDDSDDFDDVVDGGDFDGDDT